MVATGRGTPKIVRASSWCPGRELNPHSRCRESDFKSDASADFATRARWWGRTKCSTKASPRRSALGAAC